MAAMMHNDPKKMANDPHKMVDDTTRKVKIIEWHEMDMRRFLVGNCCLSLFVRGSVYPSMLVKTRLQVQKGTSLYFGTWDAFKKILRYEGVRGFYKGFFVSIFGIVGEQSYFVAYELTRRACRNFNNTMRSSIAGGSASLVSLTIRVPLDVMTRRLMLLGQTADGTATVRKVGFQDMVSIMRGIHIRHGLGGFYRGYLASLMTNVPNSALFWPFYHFYTERIANILNSTIGVLPPMIVLQACTAPVAACSSAVLTNPMDTIRTRLQVTGERSIPAAFSQLIKEEGARGLTKGLTARFLSTIPNSFVMIIGYETIKKFSKREET